MADDLGRGPTHRNDVERARTAGVREGVDDATIAAHTGALQKINTSIARLDEALSVLETEVRSGLDRLAGEIRTLQEEARAAVLAVKVSRDTLATETERRRKELAGEGESGARKFTRNQQTIALIIALGGLLLAATLALRGVLF